MKPRSAIRLVPVLLLAAACQPWNSPDASNRAELVHRFIQNDPEIHWANTLLYDWMELSAWKFDDSEDLESWKILPMDAHQMIRPDGLALRSSNDWIRLIRNVELQAAVIDNLEMVFSRPFTPRTARLSWRGASDPDFDDTRSLMSEPIEGTTPPVHRFALDSNEHWTGQITHLRFDFVLKPAQEVLIREIRPVRTDLEKPLSTVGQAMKMELDQEVRNVLLAMPGQAIEQRVRVPSGAMLRTGLGLQPDTAKSVEFRVTASPITEAGGNGTGGTIVLSKSLRPWLGEDGEWHDVEVDLAKFHDQLIDLRLETSSDELVNDIGGFAVWSNPVVVRPGVDKKRPNVILISIDTLRADHLSLYGYEKKTSPRIDAWAQRRAVTFLHTVAPSPWTLPSHISMFTGLDTLSHSSNYNNPAPQSLDTLAELLRKDGYSTAAFTGGGFVHPRFGLSQGFDRYVAWQDRILHNELKDSLDLTLSWLRDAPEPFFVFLHTYEVHSPYDRREPYYSQLWKDSGSSQPDASRFVVKPQPTGRDQGFLVPKFLFVGEDKRVASAAQYAHLRRLYDSGIAYTDAQLGRLFDRLRESGLEERTIVVLTSDHGEALGEHGLGGHAYLYDFNLMIPLVIAVPGANAAGTRVDLQVRLIDLLPTVLDLAQLPIPPNLDGVSLAPSFEGRLPSVPREAWSYAASSNYGVSLRMANRLKLIYNNTAWEPLQGQESFFNLRRDPQEQHDSLTPGPEKTLLREKIFERLQAYSGGVHLEFANPTEEWVRGQLRGRQLIHPTRVKTSSPIPDAVITQSVRETMDFKVPPNTSFSIYLEAVGHETLIVEIGSVDGSSPYVGQYDVQDLEPTRRIEWVSENREWRELEALGSATDVPYIEMQWRGREWTNSEALSSPDDELKEQLRALGYVE